ncbi:hypothetical protein [Polaromonas sp.]|nr:hypothetical protein [Polaromonas sp.]NML85727.1 hypothetical protein [Polaromonas sp.]
MTASTVRFTLQGAISPFRPLLLAASGNGIAVWEQSHCALTYIVANRFQ